MLTTHAGLFDISLIEAKVFLEEISNLGVGAYFRLENLRCSRSFDSTTLTEITNFFLNVANLIFRITPWIRPNHLKIQSRSFENLLENVYLDEFGMHNKNSPTVMLTLLIDYAEDAPESFERFFSIHEVNNNDMTLCAVVSNNIIRFNPIRSGCLINPCHKCCEYCSPLYNVWTPRNRNERFMVEMAALHFISEIFLLGDELKFVSQLSRGAIYNLKSFSRIDFQPISRSSCNCV